jgi:GT2 family glycosyltransferase
MHSGLKDRLIIAVVVTYNRVSLLREVLASLEGQSGGLDEIIVVDNASTDGTAQFLTGWQGPRRTNIRQTDNTGGAGGFKTGIKSAFDRKADWIWCMDDDCVPRDDALERLLEAARAKPAAGFFASRVLWTDGSPCLMNGTIPLVGHKRSPTETITPIAGCSFVSVLISRAAVADAGLPVAEFFIWYDDVEYTRRISVKFPSYLVPDSIAIHKTLRNSAPLDFAEMDESNIWKFVYGVRNETSYRLRSHGLLSSVRFLARIARRMGAAGVPVILMGRIVMAWARGLAFDYRRFIEFPAGHS